MRYEIREGLYCLIDDNETVIETSDEVAVIYDNSLDRTVLFAYGTLERITKQYHKAKSDFRKHNYPEWADNLKMISGKYPIRELNKLMTTTGYINEFIKNHELDLARAQSGVH